MLRHWKKKGPHGAGVGRALLLGQSVREPEATRRAMKGCVVLLRAYQVHEVGRAYDLNTAVLAKPQ